MNTPDPKDLLAALERRDAENRALRTGAEARFQAKEIEEQQLSDAEISSGRDSLRASLILTALLGGVLSISAIRDLVKAATGGATLQDAPVAMRIIEPYDPGSDGGEGAFMDSPDAPFGADGRAGTSDDDFPKMVVIKLRRPRRPSAIRLKSGGIEDGTDFVITFPEPPEKRVA